MLRKFHDLKMKQKVLIGTSVPLVLLVGLAAVSITSMETVVDSNRWVSHTYNVLDSAAQTVSSAVDMETGLRGYLLTGQEDFLAPYESGQARAYDMIAGLQDTVSDNPTQVARLDEAADVLREWQAAIADPEITLRRQIGDAPSMNDMAANVREGRGKTYFDNFRGTIGTFIDTERALLDQRTIEAEAIAEDLRGQLGALGEAVAWVDHTHGVIGTANDILAAAVDMETGMRGYLLAGDETFLEPFNVGRDTFLATVDALQQTVSDNPTQVARLDEVRATMQMWLDTVGRKLINGIPNSCEE